MLKLLLEKSLLLFLSLPELLLLQLQLLLQLLLIVSAHVSLYWFQNADFSWN